MNSVPSHRVARGKPRRLYCVVGKEASCLRRSASLGNYVAEASICRGEEERASQKEDLEVPLDGLGLWQSPPKRL
eukprot:gene10529-biopygen1955